MSKQAEGELILKLYELRREATMRKARDWFFREFHPETFDDVNRVMYGEHSAHARMVISYWDMAAALVKHGAIGSELFNDANGEHYNVFAKLELLLPELRAAYGPQMLANLEELIVSTRGGRERILMVRERLKGMRAAMAAMPRASDAEI